MGESPSDEGSLYSNTFQDECSSLYLACETICRLKPLRAWRMGKPTLIELFVYLFRRRKELATVARSLEEAEKLNQVGLNVMIAVSSDTVAHHCVLWSNKLGNRFLNNQAERNMYTETQITVAQSR